MMRMRNTANGLEVWDPLKKEWYSTSSENAQKMLSNSLFPRHYHPQGSRQPSKIRTLRDGLTKVEVKAGKAGRS